MISAVLGELLPDGVLGLSLVLELRVLSFEDLGLADATQLDRLEDCAVEDLIVPLLGPRQACHLMHIVIETLDLREL